MISLKCRFKCSCFLFSSPVPFAGVPGSSRRHGVCIHHWQDPPIPFGSSEIKRSTLILHKTVMYCYGWDYTDCRASQFFTVWILVMSWSNAKIFSYATNECQNSKTLFCCLMYVAKKYKLIWFDLVDNKFCEMLGKF